MILAEIELSQIKINIKYIFLKNIFIKWMIHRSLLNNFHQLNLSNRIL